MKKTIAFVLLVIILFAGFYGMRFWQQSKVSASLADAPTTNGLLTDPVTLHGTTYAVSETALYDFGLTAEDVPAIDAPKFISISEADNTLADEVFGVSLELNGVARFYSYQIMNWHQVVNDEIGDVKFAVTTCPLCRSAVVYDRVVHGTARHFEISGKVYNNNTVLRDRETGSEWLQLRGVGVSGSDINTVLNPIPSTPLTWADFKRLHPDGEVLSTETGVIRDYTRHPYTSYDTAKSIYFPVSYRTDALSSKWLVKGIVNDDQLQQMVFSNTIMLGVGVANETFDDMPIVAFYDQTEQEIRIFDARITADDGSEQTLTFTYDFDKQEFIDNETKTVWDSHGNALKGKLVRTSLTEKTSRESFWMCWSAEFPDTFINQVDKHDAQAEE